MTKDEALRMALEYLEESNSYLGSLDYSEPIAAIKEALAQPKREILGNVDYIPCCTDQTCPKCKPPQSEPEWVGLTEEDIDSAEIHLTSCRNNHESWIEGIHEFANALEAKLKEKNT